MTDAEVWSAIESERTALLRSLMSLSPQDWDVQSLCSEWRVRDVVAHVLLTPSMSVPRMLPRLAANRFNVERTLARQARGHGSTAPATLLTEFESIITRRGTPPGAGPINVFADVVVHGLDIRRPLGLRREGGEERLLAAADILVASDFNAKSKSRAAELRLEATDIDWTAGEGPLVTGPLDVIVLGICGRRDALRDLRGPGVAVLSERCAF